MNHYILPKINFNIQNINPTINNTIIDPYISLSFINYYNNLYNQQKNIQNNIFSNSYEFIYTKIPEYNLSVSKLKFAENIYYDLVEISNSLNLFKNLTSNILCINKHIDIIKFIKNNNDIFFILNEIPKLEDKMDFIFYEIENSANINLYILDFIKIIMIILKNQNSNGNCLLKINHLFYKPIIDLVYILNSIYKKVYIIKPSTSNNITHEKYILFTQFIDNNINIDEMYNTFQQFLEKYTENKNIISIIDFEIPLYFTNKINDINILFGQQQLEALNQNLSFNNDKLKIIIKNNIQKSILWCEKNNIPHHKFIEKTNIFLQNPLLENLNL